MLCTIIQHRKKIRNPKMWRKTNGKLYVRNTYHIGLGRKRRRKTEIRRLIPENGKLKGQLDFTQERW